MRAWTAALIAALTLGQATAAARRDIAAADVAYLLVDVASGRTLQARWDDPAKPLPLGSLIKPFVALAYADAHGLRYPEVNCRGVRDRCWLPRGHGRLGIVEAMAQSCNAYFLRLADGVSPRQLAATLGWFGLRWHSEDSGGTAATTAAMIGLGREMALSPAAAMRGYVELIAREGQPGVAPLVDGLRASARVGTGKALSGELGPLLAGAGALVKTGTAPCSHVRRAAGDGYALALYPGDRPRLAVLVQAHGHTGAETAALAGAMLRDAAAAR